MLNWKTQNGYIIKLIKAGITNCYLIEYENTCILVDTGQKRAYAKLQAFLNGNLRNLNLNYILQTHTHYDHAGNTKKIRDKFHARVIVHEKEAECLSKGFTTLPKGTNIVTKIISNSGNRYASWIGEYENVEPNITVNSDYLIDENPTLQIIETPGHTAGSVSLIIDNEIALVGDTLFGIVPQKAFPPFADNKIDLFKSWEKLLTTNCRLFLPAHGKALTREIMKKELLKRK